MASLKIFLSYAKEDEPFARAIGQRLSSIFKQSVELTQMSRFPLGVNWATLIDEAVDRADILLIIATGRKRASHSYTGYEVGYFRKSSQEHRKCIDDKGEIPRLIIPFSIFTGTPPAVDEFQGVAFQENRLDYDVDATGQSPFFKLLDRINGILNKLGGITPDLNEQKKTREEFLEQDKLFGQDVKSFMVSLPLSSEFPNPRLTIHLPANSTPRNIKIDDSVRLSCNGPTAGIFELQPSDQPVSWSDFSKRIGSPDIALIWNDALRSIASSTLEGNFADTGQLVFSSVDDTKLYRLFLAETRKYYDGTQQLDIYPVEILHDKDVGNAKTTFLAKMIAIHMAYRSLFLENEGPYSSNAISLLMEKEKWKPTINDMLRDLRLLYSRSREAGAFNPRWLTEIFGGDPKSIENIRRMKNELSGQLERLNRTAADVLDEPDPTQGKFDAFVQALDEFRTKTHERDTPYLTKILEHLKHMVGG